MFSIDASLRRLGTDHVDLYQIHRFDPGTPMEETIEALHDVVKAGKALYAGASSMYAWQFARMLYAANRLGFTRFVAMQNHYNLMYREEEREMIPLCVVAQQVQPHAGPEAAGPERSARKAMNMPTSCTLAKPTTA